MDTIELRTKLEDEGLFDRSGGAKEVVISDQSDRQAKIKSVTSSSDIIFIEIDGLFD